MKNFLFFIGAFTFGCILFGCEGSNKPSEIENDSDSIIILQDSVVDSIVSDSVLCDSSESVICFE